MNSKNKTGSFLSFIITYNLFIGFAAAAVCWETYILFSVLPKWKYIFFLFVSTSLVYNHHLLINFKTNESGLHRYGLYSLLIFLFLTAAILGFNLEIRYWMLLAPATVISLLYSYSYLGNKKLREIPFLKIFFISLIWAYTTVFIPLGGSGIIQYSSLILMFFQRFFFIFAITIPFDIRDIEKDRRSNLKTIPTEKGAGFSKVLAIVALFLSLILWMINKKGTGNVFHSLVPFLFSAIYAGVLIILSKPQRKTFYYTFLVDGALVIQALMVFLLY